MLSVYTRVDTTMSAGSYLLRDAGSPSSPSHKYHSVQFSVVTSRCQGQLMVRRAGGSASRAAALSRISRASLSPHAMSSASTALLRACALLLCLVAGSRQLTKKEFFVPTAVMVGEKAELRCQYELKPEETEAALYVKWWWTPATAAEYDRTQIYQRIAGQPPETIQHQNASKIEILPNDTIVLTEVSPLDSGMYECEVSNIEELRMHDKLVVYSEGTGPLINVSEIEDPTNVEKTMLLIECQAEGVTPKPTLTVTVAGQEVKQNSYVEDDNQDGFYTIYVNATRAIDNLEPQDVQCEMFYSDDSIVHAQYIVSTTYVPEGYDKQSTTEMPEDTTQPETSTESLQNPSDDGVRLQCSLVLLACAAILTHLHTIL